MGSAQGPMPLPMHTYTEPCTHTHAHAPTHTQPCTHMPTHTATYTHSCPRSYTHPHTHTSTCREGHGKQRYSPCSPSPKDQGDGIAGQHSRQAGEVRVPVRGPLANPLVQLHLQERPADGADLTRCSPRLLSPGHAGGSVLSRQHLGAWARLGGRHGPGPSRHLPPQVEGVRGLDVWASIPRSV